MVEVYIIVDNKVGRIEHFICLLKGIKKACNQGNPQDSII